MMTREQIPQVGKLGSVSIPTNKVIRSLRKFGRTKRTDAHRDIAGFHIYIFVLRIETDSSFLATGSVFRKCASSLNSHEGSSLQKPEYQGDFRSRRDSESFIQLPLEATDYRPVQHEFPVSFETCLLLDRLIRKKGYAKLSILSPVSTLETHSIAKYEFGASCTRRAKFSMMIEL